MADKIDVTIALIGPDKEAYIKVSDMAYLLRNTLLNHEQLAKQLEDKVRGRIASL